MNKTYHNEDLNISLEMPFTWQATHNEHLPLILIAPMEKSFRANMSITVTPLESATPEALQIVRDSAREDRIANYADFELVSDKEITQEGLSGYIEHYHWTTDDTHKPVTQIFALLLNEAGAMVSIHGTCLRKLEEKYLARFHEVIASLRFEEV